MSELIHQLAAEKADNKKQSAREGKSKPILQDNRISTMQHKSLIDSLPVQRKNNTGMPDKLKTGIESLSGMSMDHVKVHYNSAKPAQLCSHTYNQANQFNKTVKHNYQNSPVKQLFQVPAGLTEVSDSITGVSDEIRKTSPKKGVLPNGDRWAREVQSAAYRHLNEWKLYKTMQQDYPKHTTSFGSDNTVEPDVMVKDKKGKLIAAGESKYVTGNAKQVRKNTQSAQKQLLDGNRAQTYASNVDRYAFITVDPNSDAGERIKKEKKVKGQKAFNNRKRAAEDDHDEARKKLKVGDPNATFKTHINIGDDPVYSFL